jgi:hypothetical protein
LGIESCEEECDELRIEIGDEQLINQAQDFARIRIYFGKNAEVCENRCHAQGAPNAVPWHVSDCNSEGTVRQVNKVVEIGARRTERMHRRGNVKTLKLGHCAQKMLLNLSAKQSFRFGCNSQFSRPQYCHIAEFVQL